MRASDARSQAIIGIDTATTVSIRVRGPCAVASNLAGVNVVTVIAGVVSALAALGALWFARDTVRESRALRREDRLARLPELVAEHGTFTINAGSATAFYTIPRARLAVMLAPLDEPLPACRTLASDPEFDNPQDVSTERIEQVTLAALNELADLLRADRQRERE